MSEKLEKFIVSFDEVEKAFNKENPNDDIEETAQFVKKDFVQWNKRGYNSFFPETDLNLFKKIPAGIFDIKYSRHFQQYFLSKKHISLDELFTLPDPIQDQILKDVTSFWTREEIFKKYKFVYKRGILLYGAAGTGKSSIINLLMNEIIKKYEGIVFFLNDEGDLEPFMEFIPDAVRQIEPNRPILCIIEDIENFTHRSSDEAKLLNLLDGLNQVHNVVYLATTNYPEQLKERILNRPSRFDRRYEIKAPNAKIRKYYFEKKLKQEDLESIDLKDWVKKTKGLTIAHLGEIIKSVFCLGNDFETTLKELEEMKKKLSSFEFNKPTNGAIGFSKNGVNHEEDYEF